MVDIVRKKKTWTTKRILTIVGILALAFLIGGSFYFTSGKSKLNVDLERITVSEITKAPFQESIPQNGTVLPLTTIYLVTTDGGRVETRYVEDGAILKAGDPILKLANTDQELSMSNAATSVSQMLATTQYAEVQAAQNTVGKQTS